MFLSKANREAPFLPRRDTGHGARTRAPLRNWHRCQLFAALPMKHFAMKNTVDENIRPRDQGQACGESVVWRRALPTECPGMIRVIGTKVQRCGIQTGSEELRGEGGSVIQIAGNNLSPIQAAFSCNTHDPCLTWFC